MKVLAGFYSLPLREKEQCLSVLFATISRMCDAPIAAAAMLRIFDAWYKTVEQEKADIAMRGSPDVQI